MAVLIGNMEDITDSSRSALLDVGAKFTAGGAHISRTVMLSELQIVLSSVAPGSTEKDYRDAILQRNVLGKATDSTKNKSLRHLRELYALSEHVPIFSVLRRLATVDANSLPLLAFLCAWCRDPLLRSTTAAVLPAPVDSIVDTATLAQAIAATFPGQYSELNQNKVARNAASSWTQAGHLVGRSKKRRRYVRPTFVAGTMALWLSEVAGFHGTLCFESPFCRLLDLGADQAKALAIEAHRHGLLTLRSIGEIVELSFPLFPSFGGGMQHE